MKNVLLHIKILAFAWIAVLLISCNKPANNQMKDITVSIAPIAFLTERICPVQYKIHTMVPKGMSPETYEPTPQQLIALAQSKIFFYTGNLGFEQTWLKKMQQNAPHTLFSRTDSAVLYIENSHTHDNHIHKGADPHIWTTPENLQIMARNICQKLIEIYPEDQKIFRDNLKQLEDSIMQADSDIRKILTNRSQKDFLIYHPTLGYFAKTYRLQQWAIETDGKSPSPAYIRELIDICKERNIKTIFVQEEFDQRHAQLIARETNTRIVRIMPLNNNCTAELIRIAKALSHE